MIGTAEAVAMTRRLIEQLYAMVRGGTPISPEDIGRATLALRADAGVDLRELFSDTILIAGRARPRILIGGLGNDHLEFATPRCL